MELTDQERQVVAEVMKRRGQRAETLIYSRGVNDADYFVKPVINGVREYCPYYKRWTSMFQRCYSTNYQKRAYTYKGCEVCKEWWSFMAFRLWMMKQDWRGDKDLDKDFIGDGKVYSPETCRFIPRWLNKLFTLRENDRGPWPLGVMKGKGRYVSCLTSVHGNITSRHATALEAHHAYLVAILNGGKPVCDHENRASLHHPRERFLNERFGFGVEGGSRLVEDHHRCIFENGSRDGDPLALAP